MAFPKRLANTTYHGDSGQIPTRIGFVCVSSANAGQSEANALMHAMWLVFLLHGHSVANLIAFICL